MTKLKHLDAGFNQIVDAPFLDEPGAAERFDYLEFLGNPQPGTAWRHRRGVPSPGRFVPLPPLE